MTKEHASKTVVRRVKASDTDSSIHKDSVEPTQKTATVKINKKLATETGYAKSKKTFVLFRPFLAIGRYFRDSWRELRQVRWTNRRATWALTLAVVLFSAFFAIFVLLFDWVFQWLIKEVIL